MKPHIIGPNSITIIHNSRPYTIVDPAMIRVATSYLNNPDTTDEQWSFALNPVQAAVAALEESEATKHAFTTDGDWLYVNGQRIQDQVLMDYLRQLLDLGLEPDSWLRLLEKIWDNPSEFARTELLGWMSKSTLSHTEDGDLLAYKRVRSNLWDIHTGVTFLHEEGAILSMDRERCDSDRDSTCSAGIHFCSWEYLPQFSHTGGDDKILLVSINPADIVSIPSDHNETKGRTCQLKVLEILGDARTVLPNHY